MDFLDVNEFSVWHYLFFFVIVLHSAHSRRYRVNYLVFI